MTLLEFARRKVDVAVVEAGMGGKLDATVVVDPMVSVITPIGLDHTAVLGDTIEEIAADKAHIIKKDVPVISAPQPPEAHIILEQHAGSVDAPLTFCPGMDEFWDFNAWARYTDFDSRRSWMKMDNIRLPLTGSFQLINVSTALSVLEEIAKFGFRTGFDIVKMGLESVKWQGRMQIRYRRRFEIIDGAHNTMGVKVVSESVKKLFNKYKWRVIFATQKNKPAKEMIKVLKKTTVKFYLAPLQFPKSLTEEMLHSLIGETKMKADVFSNTPEALDRALQDTENNELVLVIGSLYLAGEIIRHRRKLPPPHSDGRIDDRI